MARLWSGIARPDGRRHPEVGGGSVPSSGAARTLPRTLLEAYRRAVQAPPVL